MKLYIDTNTYLSNLNTTNTDNIKTLEKLKKLINDGKVELILPSQTKNEYLKHAKDRIEVAKKKLEVKPTVLGLPNELKSKKKSEYSKEEKEIFEKIETTNFEIKKLVEKRIVEFKKHLEAVEKLIKELFGLSTIIEHSDGTVFKAVIRQAKGLPPQKENFKFGDAIIWETLKDHIRNESLVVVSYDRDFAEVGKNGKAKINNILKSEWKKNTKKEIILYTLLGNFVNSIEKSNPVSSEAIKKEAIQATTYVGIPNLVGYITPQDNMIINNSSFVRAGILGSVDTSNSLTIPVTGDINILDSSSTIISALGNKHITPLNSDSIIFSPTEHIKIKSGILGEHNVADSKVFNSTSVCTRCGKTYEYSTKGLFLANLCNDCSKYFSI